MRLRDGILSRVSFWNFKEKKKKRYGRNSWLFASGLLDSNSILAWAPKTMNSVDRDILNNLKISNGHVGHIVHEILGMWMFSAITWSTLKVASLATFFSS